MNDFIYKMLYDAGWEKKKRQLHQPTPVNLKL